MVTSCNFLDVIPSGKATEDDLFKTHIQADNFAASLYYYMPNRFHFQNSVEMCGGGDIVSSFYGSVYYFKWKSLVYDNMETPSNTYLAMWSTTCDKASGATSYNVWGGIRNAYLLLENADGVADATEEQKSRWKGEAYWNIAYMHQTLLEYYGPIVLVDHYIGLQEDINYERSTYLECVQFISDMYDLAAQYLPAKQTSNYLGRATKTTAKALKARVWMAAASPLINGNSEWYGPDFAKADGTPLIPQTYDKNLWKKAMEAAEDAIKQGEADGFTLYAPSKSAENFDKGYENYRAAFLGQDAASFFNENEYLFVFANQSTVSYNIKNMGPRMLPSYNNQGWRGYFVPTWEAVQCFLSKNGLPIHMDPETKAAAEDPTQLVEAPGFPGEQTSILHVNREPRFYASVGYDRGSYDLDNSTFMLKCRRGEPQQWDGNTGNEYQTCTGYYIKKWIDKSNYYNKDANSFTYHKFAYPYIRMAEPYMDYVEASIQYNDGKIDAKALGYLNKVRNRAGLPNFEDAWVNNSTLKALPEGKVLLDAILRERLSEFIFEGRWHHDLRRYKAVHEVLDHKTISWNLAGTNAKDFYQLTEAHENQIRTFQAPKNYWLAIPQEQLTVNPKLIQNPGY